MATIKIISGSFPAQQAQLVLDKLMVKTSNGGQKTFLIKSSIKSLERLSQSKGNVLFEMIMSDGSKIKAESNEKVAHELTKYVGATSQNPSVIELSPEQTKKQNLVAFVIICIVISFVLYQCSGSSSDDTASKSEPSPELKKIEAASYCKRMVTNSLRAPSTADFPWIVEAMLIGGDVYITNSYVDAQNGFGAQIRTNYSCTVKYNGGGYDGWILQYLTTAK